MRRGARVAEETAARLGRDPWLVAERLGVEVLEAPLVGRVTELYVEDEGGAVVVLAEGLSRARAREALAYGLGHHVLLQDARGRAQNGPHLSLSHRVEVESFAAHLLISSEMVREALLVGPAPLERWAARWGVTSKLLKRRLGLRTEKGG